MSKLGWSDRTNWVMAIVGSLIVVALTQIPNWLVNCKPELSIHETMQFRLWLGYTDEHNRLLSRDERFEGPWAVILTPLIDNTSCDNAVFVDQIKLGIATNEKQYSLTPIYLTNIHPEGDQTDWLAIEDDFTSFSVNAGESWTQDLAFKPTTAMSYAEFVAAAKTQDDYKAKLTVALKDDGTLDAACTISGKETWKDITAVLESRGRMPGYVQNRCR